jgi:hypothetical protein
MSADQATKRTIQGRGEATTTLDGKVLTVSSSNAELASPATTAHLSVGASIGVPETDGLDLTVSPAASCRLSGELTATITQVTGSRTGRLQAAGLPGLVTASPRDYEALAVRLACDPALLSSWRRRLAQNRTTRPLFDTDLFRRNIETAYRDMWKRRSEAPRGSRTGAA